MSRTSLYGGKISLQLNLHTQRPALPVQQSKNKRKSKTTL